jgi:uncharacterized protein (DUF58 family)
MKFRQIGGEQQSKTLEAVCLGIKDHCVRRNDSLQYELLMKLGLPPTSPSKQLGPHPLLSGGVSRAAWRFYTQRLTTAGRWFLLPTLALSSYAGVSLQLQGYVAFAYVTAVWWVALVAMFVYRPKVRLTARHAERICAGEVLPIDIEVEARRKKRAWLPQPDLTVIAHRLPMAMDLVPDEPLAVGEVPGRVRLNVRCERRGSHVVPGFRVESDFPFGLLRSRQVVRDERAVLVYPKFTPLGSLQLPVGRTYQPGGVAMASTIGESAEYIGNREYREGDPVKDIDWRATARMSRPIVREYREEYFMRVGVILDTHVPAKEGRRQKSEVGTEYDENFERAVSVAASVSDYMSRQDYLVDLFAAGPNLYHLTAGRSLAYLDQILDILACVEPNPEEPFETLEPAILENLSRITTVICVFLDWNETRRAFVHRLRAQGVALKVIIVRGAKPTMDPTPDADVLGAIPVISGETMPEGM